MNMSFLCNKWSSSSPNPYLIPYEFPFSFPCPKHTSVSCVTCCLNSSAPPPHIDIYIPFLPLAQSHLHRCFSSFTCPFPSCPNCPEHPYSFRLLQSRYHTALGVNCCLRGRGVTDRRHFVDEEYKLWNGGSYERKSAVLPVRRASFPGPALIRTPSKGEVPIQDLRSSRFLSQERLINSATAFPSQMLRGLTRHK